MGTYVYKEKMVKTRLIYIIKQDSHIYVPYSRPNGWTDWADIFCGHSGVAEGWHRLKKNSKIFFKIYFFSTFFFHGQRRALQLVPNKTCFNHFLLIRSTWSTYAIIVITDNENQYSTISELNGLGLSVIIYIKRQQNEPVRSDKCYLTNF